MIAQEDRAALNVAMVRHAAGDADAFDQIYRLLRARLFAFFVRQTRDRAHAEDLVQQTLLQMHVARASYLPGSEVLAWAFAIGRNALIDAARRTKREVLFESADDDRVALNARVDRGAVPDEVLEVEQSVERIRRALDELPRTQVGAFELLKNDGLSINEIAKSLGTTPGAVKLRIHRVYETLRGALAEDDSQTFRAAA